MRWALALALLAVALSCPHTAFAGPAACDPLKDIRFTTQPPFTTESFVFPSGEVQLGGCLYRPLATTRFPVLVLVAGSDDEPSAAQIYFVIHAKAFAAKGIGVFSFNKRGVGDSSGVPTGTDFKQRGDDVSAALRFVRALPSTTHVAVWGVSQAGWVIPQALRQGDGVEFVMLISPAGVNPNDQVAYFIRSLALRLGISADDALRAECLHRMVVRYYATGEGYEAAQAFVDGCRSASWFEKFRNNEEWNERIAPGGRLLTPAELAQAWRKRPTDFAFYRAPGTFADYRGIYEALDRPTLIVNGSADSLVPIVEATTVFTAAFAKNGNRDVEFKVFEGAEHGLQDGPRVRPAYLDFVSDWAAQRFGLKRP